MTSTYRFLTPDGWYRYRLEEGGPTLARSFVQRHLPIFGKQAGVPERERVLARSRAERDVEESFLLMRDIGTADLYYFDGRFGGVEMNMLFTVTAVYLGDIADRLRPDQLAEAFGGVVVDLPAGSAVRTRDVSVVSRADESRDRASTLLLNTPTTPKDQSGLVELPHQTRIDYVLPVPEEPGSFAVTSFRALGDEFADERVAHFDILMTGFAWGAP